MPSVTSESRHSSFHALCILFAATAGLPGESLAQGVCPELIPGTNTLFVDQPYDLSGTHLFGAARFDFLPQVIESCGEWEDLSNSLKPSNVSVLRPASRMELSLKSVVVEGLQATFTYDGVLTFNDVIGGNCTHVCEPTGQDPRQVRAFRGGRQRVIVGELVQVFEYRENVPAWLFRNTLSRFDGTSTRPCDAGAELQMLAQRFPICGWTFRNTGSIGTSNECLQEDQDFLESANPQMCTFGVGGLFEELDASFPRADVRLFPKRKFDFEPPRGTILGQIDVPNQDIQTDSGVDVEMATVILYPQRGRMGDQQGGESNADYEAYRRSQLGTALFTRQLMAADDGRFRFEDLPTFLTTPTAGTTVYTPVYYSVVVESAESLETAPVERTVYFLREQRNNLRALADGPSTLQIDMVPVDALPQKQSLVNQLIALAPEKYADVETDVGSWLLSLNNSPTPAQLEGIRRAILAEGMAKNAFQLADQQLGVMLGGVGSLVGDLIDDVIGNGNKKLAKQREKVGELKENLNLSRLQAWTGFTAGDPAARQAVEDQLKKLIEENPELGLSLQAELLKKGSDAAFAAVVQVLELAQVNGDDAKLAAKLVKATLDTMFAIAITQGISGSAKPLVKALISEVVENGKNSLLDSALSFSYSALTESSLRGSEQLMRTWAADNPPAFFADRQAFQTENNLLGNDVLVVSGTITAFSTAIADALGGTGVELLGLLGPKGKAAQKAATVVKYLANGVTITAPMATVYGVIAGPDTTIDIPIVFPGPVLVPVGNLTIQLGRLERGVKAAYGVSSLPTAKAHRMTWMPKKADTARFAAQQKASLGLESELTAADTVLTDALDAVVDALNADDITGALAACSDGPSSFLDSYRGYRLALARIIAARQGVVFSEGNSVERYETMISLDYDLLDEFEELSRRLEGVFLDVVLLGYAGPADPVFVIERASLVGELQAFAAELARLTQIAIEVLGQNATLTAPPAVIVDSVSLTSAGVPAQTITAAPQTFTLNATLRNIGGADASMVDARLEITDVDSAVALASGAEINVGLLAAMDTVDDGGPDQATISWDFTYTGDPADDQAILLVIDVLQDGDVPTDFRPFGRAVALLPDIELVDGDLDGMVDQWEAANGLNTAVNDADGDLDMDGLDNQGEFDIGTMPMVADSDGDNLPDGEETSLGADGYITNPLLADTDGDGTSDDLDGQPLDPDFTTPPAAAPDEPVIAVGSNQLGLTAANRTATLTVSNAGTGPLNWTAIADNDAVVSLSLSVPEIQSGEGGLIVTASEFYDFATMAPVSTTVRIYDVSGAEKDFQEVVISLGAPPNDIFADGFESP